MAEVSLEWGTAPAALLTVLAHLADVSCYMPANGETTTIFTNPSIPVDIALGLLKRETALGETLATKSSSPARCVVGSWNQCGRASGDPGQCSLAQKRLS